MSEMPGPPAGESFPRRARLQRKREFERVFSAGQRCSAPALRLIIARNDAGIPRLGLAVSRKVGGAVARNRVKRRLREIFRRERGLLPEPLDIVVVPQAGVDRLTFAELREQFLRAVGQWRPKGGRK